MFLPSLHCGTAWHWVLGVGCVPHPYVPGEGVKDTLEQAAQRPCGCFIPGSVHLLCHAGVVLSFLFCALYPLVLSKRWALGGKLKTPEFPPTIKHFHVPISSRMEGNPPEPGTPEAFCRVSQNKPEVVTRVLQAKISLTQQISDCDHQFQFLLPVQFGLGETGMGCRRRKQRSCSTRYLSLLHPHTVHG